KQPSKADANPELSTQIDQARSPPPPTQLSGFGEMYSLVVARRLRSFLLRNFHLGFKHHRRRARDTSIFSNAPEMHRHEDRCDQRNTNTVPDVRAQQSI